MTPSVQSTVITNRCLGIHRWRFRSQIILFIRESILDTLFYLARANMYWCRETCMRHWITVASLHSFLFPPVLCFKLSKWPNACVMDRPRPANCSLTRTRRWESYFYDAVLVNICDGSTHTCMGQWCCIAHHWLSLWLWTHLTYWVWFTSSVF